MSSLGSYSSSDELNQNLVYRLTEIAEDNELELGAGSNCNVMLRRLIRAISRRVGSIAVLIDEYDKPILDNLSDIREANEMREVLRSFYTVLKSCDEYLRFVFITGISKFSKMGVFSAMNNLLDISMLEQYGDIAGYTQNELEQSFTDWLSFTADRKKISRDEILLRLKNYYDGFSFDGVNRIYNPFSILSFFGTSEFRNYWYESGSPFFVVNWMQEHHILGPEEYRHIVVNGNDFISIQEMRQVSCTRAVILQSKRKRSSY